MKRFLLLLLVLYVGISIHAQTTTLTVSNDNPLADQIAALSGSYDVINIEGTLTADDVTALKDLKVGKTILMNKATLTTEALDANFVFESPAVEVIVLPKGLDEVKSSWFSSCSNLKGAMSYSTTGTEYPTSVKAHIAKAGSFVDVLAAVTLNGSQTDLGDSYDSSNKNFSNCKIHEVILSGNINQSDLSKQTVVGNALYNADINHYDLTNATLSSSSDLYYAGNDGWKGQNSLRQIELPSNLTGIPSQCFNGIANLTTIKIPHTVTAIGSQAFNQCNNLEDVEFERGFTTLNFDSGVFVACKSLKHVVLPEGLENIGDGMFDQCENLESLRLPNSLKTIGNYAFRQTYALKYLTIPEGVEIIGAAAFYNSGIQDLYLLAETPSKLPKIYSSVSSIEKPTSWGGTETINGASFGRNSLDGGPLNVSSGNFKNYLYKLYDRGLLSQFTDITQKSDIDQKSGEAKSAWIRRMLGYLTSEQAEEVYRLAFAERSANASITFLHYVNNEAMNAFLNGNKYKDNAAYEADFKNTIRNSEWSDTDLDADYNRFKSSETLTGTYAYVDSEGGTWPAQDYGDYGRRVGTYGNPNHEMNADESEYGQEPSRIAWREFVMVAGYSKKNDIIYQKSFDDTWYTICFPFDLTDEQLESAFQSDKFNICEFSGAAIQKSTKQDKEGNDVEVNNLVLCFTKIARTWYMDKYGNYYNRVKGSDGTKRYYRGTREKVTRTTSLGYFQDWDLTNISSTELSSDGNDKDIWLSIDGYLALAGHPYMIHPYQVEKEVTTEVDGVIKKETKATLCTIPDVVYKHKWNKRNELSSDDLAATIIAMNQMYENESVTRPLCETPEDIDNLFERVRDGVTVGDNKTESYGRYGLLTPTDKGNYTFKGTFFPKKDEVLIAGVNDNAKVYQQIIQ